MKFQVPLPLFGGSGNYASALYISAVKANALDIVESEIVWCAYLLNMLYPRRSSKEKEQIPWPHIGLSYQQTSIWPIQI